MADNINDYVPLMDRYPELKLRPTTEFPGCSKIQQYDYVQDLRLKDKNAPHGYFYLIVKDGLYGLYMLDRGFIWDTDSVALKPIYENINIYYFRGRHFRAIVKKNGKYGIVIWTYSDFINEKIETPVEYDSITKLDDQRFKAIKGKDVVYLDTTGKMLK